MNNRANKRAAGDTSRQTIWQFVAFLAVMAGVLIGSSIFQTEALRRETVAKIEAVNQRFEQVNQRFEQVNQRFEQVEKRLDKIEKSIEALTQEIRASRSRSGATSSVKSVSVSRRQRGRRDFFQAGKEKLVETRDTVAAMTPETGSCRKLPEVER